MSFFTLTLILILAFIPPIIFVIWFRNSEAHQREPWRAVFGAFLWGAVIGVLVGIILSLALATLLEVSGLLLERYWVRLGEALRSGTNMSFLILVIVVAPVAEELAKGLGVLRMRPMIRELEDGVVYGASAGLGFGATENLLYGAVAYAAGGLGASLTVIGVRSVSSALLHASATSAFGYGVAQSALVPGAGLLPFYLLAVVMHGTFNFFASFGEIFSGTYGDVASLFGLVAAVVLALLAVGLARSAVRRQDLRLGISRR